MKLILTFNNTLILLYVLVSIICMILFLPDNPSYRSYYNPELAVFRQVSYSVLFSILAYRKYYEKANSYFLIAVSLFILYQPFFKIPLGKFNPYVDIVISVLLLVSVIDFKGKERLIEWVKIEHQKST